MLPQIELALGAGTTTLLLLLAALLFRDYSEAAAGRLAIAFALGSAAHALTATAAQALAGFGNHVSRKLKAPRRF